nr:flagellin [Alteromonas hispanica]
MDAANIAEGIDSVLGSDSLGAGQDPIGQTVGVFIRPGNTQLRIAENVNNPSSLSINSIIGTYSSSPSASGINRKSPTSAIDGALSRINTLRTELGALENRFKSTIRSLSNISENVSDARSRIMDTDFASTTSRLTQSQIVQQASISVLAQANQRPQLALSLLE